MAAASLAVAEAMPTASFTVVMNRFCWTDGDGDDDVEGDDDPAKRDSWLVAAARTAA